MSYKFVKLSILQLTKVTLKIFILSTIRARSKSIRYQPARAKRAQRKLFRIDCFPYRFFLSVFLSFFRLVIFIPFLVFTFVVLKSNKIGSNIHLKNNIGFWPMVNNSCENYKIQIKQKRHGKDENVWPETKKKNLSKIERMTWTKNEQL